MDYFNVRKAHFIEKWTVRRIARTYGVSRNTVKKYIVTDELPQYRRSAERDSPVLGPFFETIDQLIKEDLERKTKERFTAHTFYRYLKNSHGYIGSENTLRKYFCQRRRELAGLANVTVPLLHPPNGEAQVDWIEDITVIIADKQTIVQGFCMRLNHSKKPFLKVYHSMGMECWLDGHRSAFEYFGGVPSRVTYDNPKVAVTKVLKGRKRLENDKFVGFKGYYGFDSFYCMVRTPEEKGGVENAVGYIRRNFFVPYLKGDTLDDINRQLVAMCNEEDGRIPQGSKESIGSAFQIEKRALHQLPGVPYDCCQVKYVKIAGKTSTFKFDKNYYSVPTKYIYRTLTLKAYPDSLVICDENEVVATHRRLYDCENEYVLDPLHYLSCLKIKPALLEHGKPFADWGLPEEFNRYQEALMLTYDREKARRDYIRVLLELQDHGLEEVQSAIRQALCLGCCQPEAVIGIIKMNECSSAVVAGGHLEEPAWQHIKVIQPECRAFDDLIYAEREVVMA